MPRSRRAVARDHAVVVQAQQLDHVVDVRLGLDPARGRAGLAGEDRVVVDAALLVELAPNAFGKPKWATWSPCRWPISRPPTPEGELAALAGAGLDAGPEVTSSVIRSLAVSPIRAVSFRCRIVEPDYKFK